MNARANQVVFTASLLLLCWLGMMAVHELGHVLGALATGGAVERVVLHPLAISRTDVSPNPHPAIVVWLGPIVGCVLPLALAFCVPQKLIATRNTAKFFAGFCLVANGAYIAIGSFDSVGDCGVMLETGSPIWTLIAFGSTSIAIGLFTWHKIGSLGTFLAQPSVVAPRLTYAVTIALTLLVSLGFLIGR